jgi:predicted nuclease with TOPRIM domain
MSGLIPIKLAEQAMANLEAELTDLKSTTDRFEVENSILMKETARLQAEVEHLTSENKLVREESDRHYQLWVDSQAALNSSDHAVWTLAVENTRLKAEVERLKEGNECLDKMHEKEMARSAYLLEEFNRLKAENERLRKAGDDMASSIQFNEEMEKDYDGPTIVHPSVERWKAAKEGKQS